MSKKHLTDISLPDLELAMREIRAFEAENYMLENMLESLQQSSPHLVETPSNQQAKKRGGKGSQETAKAAPASLSIQQKMNLVQQMQDQQKTQLQAARDRSDKLINEMTTRMDAQDEQMSSIMVERLCLKQAFGSHSDGTAKPVTVEKFSQYLEDSLRRKDGEMDKLHTKQKGLRAAVAKCDRELKHKEEAGESLKQIDFEQLRIENKQLLESIDARNSEVLGLKATSGRAQWALNKTKDQLAKTLQSTEWLQASKAQKRQQMDKMRSELMEAEKVVDKEKAYKRMLNQRLETSNNVPSVLEYVQQSEQLTTLKSRIKLLSTKITVGEGQLHQLKRTLRSQEFSSAPNDAF